MRACILINALPGCALKVSADVRGLPGVATVDAVTGDDDVVAVCEGPDINAIRSLIHKVEGVKTVTCLVLLGASSERLGGQNTRGWPSQYQPDEERLRTMREHIWQLWTARSPKRFSLSVALIGSPLTLASLLNLYQVLVWIVGGIAHRWGGRARTRILRAQLYCADIYVLIWLIGLLLLIGSGPNAVWGFGPVLALWRVVDILSTNLRIFLIDVPRLGWKVINPARSLALIVPNVVELVVAFAVILTWLESQAGHFGKLGAIIPPSEAIYLSGTTMFTLGGGLTPLDDLGRYFVVAALGSGLIMVAIVISGVVGSVASGEPREA